MKRRFKPMYIVIFILAAIIVTSIFYTAPKKVNIDTGDVSLDIEICRHLFKPTTVNGKITVDGSEYISCFDSKAYDVYAYNSFLENLKLKLAGNMYCMFILSDNYNTPIKAYEDYLTLGIEDSYYKINFTSINNTDGISQSITVPKC